jgi:hypothetical protein
MPLPKKSSLGKIKEHGWLNFCAVKASLIRGKLIRAGWRVSPTRNFILEDTDATFSNCLVG